jgi:hypothetical protein
MSTYNLIKYAENTGTIALAGLMLVLVVALIG